MQGSNWLKKMFRIMSESNEPTKEESKEEPKENQSKLAKKMADFIVTKIPKQIKKSSNIVLPQGTNSFKKAIEIAI
jgi:hypothetical protein